MMTSQFFGEGGQAGNKRGGALRLGHLPNERGVARRHFILEFRAFSVGLANWPTNKPEMLPAAHYSADPDRRGSIRSHLAAKEVLREPARGLDVSGSLVRARRHSIPERREPLTVHEYSGSPVNGALIRGGVGLRQTPADVQRRMLHRAFGPSRWKACTLFARGRAAAARLVHTQQVGGASPSRATSFSNAAGPILAPARTPCSGAMPSHNWHRPTHSEVGQRTPHRVAEPRPGEFVRIVHGVTMPAPLAGIHPERPIYFPGGCS